MNNFLSAWIITLLCEALLSGSFRQKLLVMYTVLCVHKTSNRLNHLICKSNFSILHAHISQFFFVFFLKKKRFRRIRKQARKCALSLWEIQMFNWGIIFILFYHERINQFMGKEARAVVRAGRCKEDASKMGVA